MPIYNDELGTIPPYGLPPTHSYRTQEIAWNGRNYFYIHNYQDLSELEHQELYSLPRPDAIPAPPISQAIATAARTTATYAWSSVFDSTNDLSIDPRLSYTGASIPNAVKESTQSGPWPIGSIIKWNTKLPEIKDHLKSKGLSLTDPLLKIISYDSSNHIGDILFIGDIENQYYGHDIKYFLPATSSECQKYEEAHLNLKQCTSRPEIGTVLEYIGSASELKGKRGTVIAECRDKLIFFHWFNNIRANEIIDFRKFRIAESQRYGFTPVPNAYCQCEFCGSRRPKEDNILKINLGKALLNFCDNDCIILYGLKKCNHCSKWHNKNELQESSRGHVCIPCLSAFFHICSECNNIYRLTDLLQSDSSNDRICHNCHENSKKLIHDHSYKPIFSFQKMVWENTRYLGIELEIEIPENYSRSKIADRIKVWLSQQPKTKSGKKINKLVYMKNDGSLNNGIEIVFHPFTLKAFHENFKLQPFLKFLQDNNAQISRNCGMHVHVSKEKLTTNQLLRGKWFFHKCEQFLKKFSDRSKFDYCRFDSVVRDNPYEQEYGHYSVLNLGVENSKTLEVRIFNATLDYKKFLANLQFSDVFVDYIQNAPGLTFFKTASSHIIWQDFIDYAKRKNMYQILTSYILLNRIV